MDIDTSIYQSNKRYKFGSKVNEDPVTIGTVTTKQSGFAYTAFYFTRKNTVTSTDTLFDVLNPRASATIDITGLTKTDLGSEAENADENTIVWDSNLYWYRKTIGSLSGSTVTLNDVTGIRPSSLMKIDGAFYLVTEVNGNSVTVDSPVPSTATVVYAAIAGVVNNTVPEGEGGTMLADGYYSAPSRDDGDRMIESVDEITTGTTWKWSASICSSNMTDGAVTLHYVVFDQAGNFTPDTVACNVANNAPRLASLKVWSDFNEDGNEQEGEYDTFWYNGKPRFINSTSQTKATELTSELVVSNNKKDFDKDGTAFMTVKAKTRFIPEIVGGNNALYYSYRYKKNKASNWTSVAYGDNSIGNGFVHGIQEEPVLDATDDDYYLQSEDGGGYIKGRTNLYAANYNGTKYYMEIPGEGAANSYSLNGIGNSNSANDPTWFEYTIYDSTDGSATDWKNVENEVVKYNTANRLSAKFRVALNLQYVDTERPQTVISPLYWNSVSDNSVYKDVNGTLFGHVELKGDLVDENGDANCELGTTYGTDDDKVSGKVVFKGFAYDNKKLSALNWAIVEHNNSGYDSPSYKFDSAMKTGATFADGKWTNSNDMTNNHYTFVVSDKASDGAYHNQNGHKVAWTLTVDTSHIGGIVGENLRLIVQAVDTQAETATTRLSTISNTENISTVNPETNPATYDSQTYRSTYKFDVLPYITKVNTRLASEKGKVFARTAQGHYSIASNEGAITLSGYNLAASNADVTITANTVAGMSSGKYSYTVSGTGENAITTINNINNNGAHGDYNIAVEGLSDLNKYTNMYNHTPDTTLNLTLTDDIYFDIWTINSRAAQARDGTVIDEPVMKINPNNGMIGFAFASGADTFCMPNGTSNSYNYQSTNYANFSNITFDYDTNGAAHAIAVGLDTNAGNTVYGGRMAYMSSIWGRSDSYTATKDNFAPGAKLRIDSIGIPSGVYVNGTAAVSSKVNPNRFKSSALKVADHGDYKSVYLAYCDTMTGQIRFRTGTTLMPFKASFGQFADAWGYTNGNTAVRINTNADGSGNEASTGTGDESQWNSHRIFDAAVGNYSLIAGKESITGTSTGYTGGSFVDIDVIPGSATKDSPITSVSCGDANNNNVRTLTINGYNLNNGSKLVINFTSDVKYDRNTTPKLNLNNSGNKELRNGTNSIQNNNSNQLAAGPYYAQYNGTYWNLTALPENVYADNSLSTDDIVVVVFHDGHDLYYTYRIGDKTQDANINDTTYWGTPQKIFTGIGKYATVKAGPDGSVHIACFDNSNGALKYAYLSSYTSTTPKTATIDGYQIVGSNISIDIVKEGTNYIPYLSYYMGSLEIAKYAKLVDASRLTGTESLDGCDSDDRYTGVWEVSFIPTANAVNDDNTNIGFYKNANGEALAIKSNSTASATGTAGTCNGNGTSNPAIAYGIEDDATGYIETAQLK